MTDACCGPVPDSEMSLTRQMVYFYILEAFPRLERPPSVDEMERNLFLPRERIASILNSLAAEGALRLGPVPCMILDAYPYSAVPTRHRVHVREGRQLYCMCAVDSFYVPFLTGQDVGIRSQCFHCRCGIEMAVEGGRITSAEPADSVVWSSASSYDCPMTNFFCCKDHLLQWRETVPDEQGRLLTLAEALEAGQKAAERITRSRQRFNDILWAEAGQLVCYCRQVPKATIVAAIANGASSAEEIARDTTACTGAWCEDTNPRGRCCCTELQALIEAYSGKLRGG
jgi:bacterioferritin-associated ferredoxin